MRRWIRNWLIGLAKKHFGLFEECPHFIASKSTVELIIAANEELAGKNEEFVKENEIQKNKINDLTLRLSNRENYITHLEGALGYHKIKKPNGNGTELGNG